MSVCPPDRLVGTTIVNTGSSPVDCKGPDWPCLGDAECAPLASLRVSQPPGSIPVVTADITGGPYLNAIGDLSEIGPQLDVQFVNTSSCRVSVWASLDGLSGFGFMEPGAFLTYGAAIFVSPVNGPPPPDITPANALLAGSQNSVQNTSPGPGPAFAMHSGNGTTDGEFADTGILLDPGEFVWIGIQGLIRATGFTGPSAWFTGIFGSGQQVQFLGVPA